ncbi:MAG TPA: MFS transporter [Gemmataceae bacterium]|jgi:MFS family permease|nr:MFS transporter [Gemmataceae bacterium]
MDPEPTNSARLWTLPSDVVLLFATRVLRMLAYGSSSLVLVLYLAALDFDERQIGLLLAMTLLGDAAISLWITTVADRLGRKRMLIAGSLLMVLGGVVFAGTSSFVPLLLAATIGVISPSGNEVGPFLAIEQAALAQNVGGHERTRMFAWYHLAGSLATAAGALLAGLCVQVQQGLGNPAIQSYRSIFLAYAVIGLVLGVIFLKLKPASEVPHEERVQKRAGRLFLGLHRSRGVVLKLSALFALDAFAGGFVLQSLIVYWFKLRFDAEPATLGGILFGANVLAGFSALVAAALARRFGLLRTMVFSHVPSNVLLILVPLMPTLPLAVAVLFLRFAISQMDVPARQSYTLAVVAADERSAAAGVTGVARTIGASLSPLFAGPLLATAATARGLFFIAGGLKLVYDGILYVLFRRLDAPEETEKPE